MTEKVDCVVIGAGVVGLAIARALAGMARVPGVAGAKIGLANLVEP
jgi:glycine/D-amino acid oxidase-like deaminating enzyme